MRTKRVIGLSCRIDPRIQGLFVRSLTRCNAVHPGIQRCCTLLHGRPSILQLLLCICHLLRQRCGRITQAVIHVLHRICEFLGDPFFRFGHILADAAFCFCQFHMNVLCCLSQMILCQPDLLTELTAYSPVVFIKDFRSSRDRQLGDIADTSFLTQHDDQFLILFCLVPDAAMLRDDASANILRHRTHLPSAQKRSDYCTGQIIRYPPPEFSDNYYGSS